MPTERIKDLINQCKDYGLKEIFFVGGEPFVRKDFFELVEYAASKNLKTSVATSGVLFTEEVNKKIVNSNLTMLLVSIDGAKSSTHDFHRSNGVFNKAIDGIRKLNEMKMKLGKGKLNPPIIAMISIIDNSNLEEIVDMINLAENLDLTGIAFQPLQTDNTVMMEKDVNHPLWIPKKRLKILDKMMKLVKKKQMETSLTWVCCDTELIRKYFRCDVTYEDMLCYMDYLRMCITPESKLTTCDKECDGKIGEGIGDISVYPIKKLWKSREMKTCRLKEGKCNSVCLQRCVYIDAVVGNVDNLSIIMKPIMNYLNSLEVNISEKRLVVKNCIDALSKYKLMICNYIYQINLLKKHYNFGRMDISLQKNENMDEFGKKIMEIDNMIKKIENLGIK